MSLVPCYCQTPSADLAAAAHQNELPDHVLVNDCCYKSLCWALRLHGKLPLEDWRTLSAYRGNIFSLYPNRIRGSSGTNAA